MIDTEHMNILTSDEKMGKRLDTNDKQTREDLPAKKKRNKKKDSSDDKKSKDASRGKKNKEGKRVQEASAPVTLNRC